jgi:hypothetical protein
MAPLPGTGQRREPRALWGARYASNKVASYPQVRAVSLTALPTHLIVAIEFGHYGRNGMLYAKALINRIEEHSLTVSDMGFV